MRFQDGKIAVANNNIASGSGIVQIDATPLVDDEGTGRGYDLRYAQQTPLPEGGRRIVIATDRPIGFWEQTNNRRTLDYRSQ